MSAAIARRTRPSPPRYPLQRTVYVGDEVYAFGRWFPSITAYDAFLHEVERAELSGEAR